VRSESSGGGGDTSAAVSSSPSEPDVSVLRDEANFIQNVSQFYNLADLSDVVLVVGADRYFSHKFVLAKSSDVFRTMLYEKNWTQSSK